MANLKLSQLWQCYRSSGANRFLRRDTKVGGKRKERVDLEKRVSAERLVPTAKRLVEGAKVRSWNTIFQVRSRSPQKDDSIGYFPRSEPSLYRR